MPRLIVLQGPDKGRTFQTVDEPVVLGRSSEQAPLTDNTVSRRHAELRLVDGAWVIEDLGSSNGTFMRLRKPRELKQNDLLLVGQQLLRVDLGG